MSGFIVLIAMVGAWLLLAGPVYQAYIELNDADLRAQEIREKFAKISESVDVPEVSKWFWVFPPLGFALNSNRQRKIKHEVFMRLGEDYFENTTAYMTKAHGWVVIGWGALFIAVKETFEFVEYFELGNFVFGVLILLGGLFSFLNTFLSARRTEVMRSAHDVVGSED